MPECCHKLCKAEAVVAVDVVDSAKAHIFIKGEGAGERHYELCEAHDADYFPRGHDCWMAREQAVRLRIQCKAMA